MKKLVVLSYAATIVALQDRSLTEEALNQALIYFNIPLRFFESLSKEFSKEPWEADPLIEDFTELKPFFKIIKRVVKKAEKEGRICWPVGYLRNSYRELNSLLKRNKIQTLAFKDGDIWSPREIEHYVLRNRMAIEILWK